MKKVLLAVLAVAAQVATLAQTASQTVLSGTITEIANQKLTLSFLGKPRAEAQVSRNGSFSQVLKDIIPGFYQTNLGYQIYLEPGMNLQIDRTEKDFNLSGQGSIENNLIKNIQELQWKMLYVRSYELSDAMNMVEPDMFLATIEGYKEAITELVSKAPVSSELASTLTSMLEYDAKNFIYQYKVHYGIDPAKRDSASRYLGEVIKSRKPQEPLNKEAMLHYNELLRAIRIKRLKPEDAQKLEVLENFDLNNGKLFASSISYRKLLEERLRQIAASETTLSPSLSRKDPNELRLYIVNKFVTEPIIRENLIFEAARTAFSRKRNTEAIYQNYLELAKDQEYISQINKIYSSLMALKPQARSPRFAYKDVNEKTISSEDFKGNYVYIDFWATWCRPCLAEIPALKELQKSYEGKNIRFVSISTDAVKDTQKWKDLVAKNELSGTQLIVDKTTDFYKFYQVTTIPRFIILDKEGNIIDADAKRPSNPLLRQDLDKLLN